MKATWIGEDGGPDFVEAHGIKFFAGKAMDVPEEIGAGKLLGNPFFKLEGAPKEDPNAGKADVIRQLEADVSSAQSDLDKAKASDKQAAQAKLDDARAKLAEAKK